MHKNLLSFCCDVENKYKNRSKISEAKIRQIVKLFTLDLDATQIAKIS